MNFLAKHFFDYQSYINLPHHALQMHKTPPSQAGTDPAAAWAPKDLHVAGKNQAAPAARANRTYHGDQRTGSHRHGRPSKLEFRAWGERHGELRAEKIVPHQEHLLHGHVDIGGGLAQRRHTASGGVDNFPSEYFPARQLLQRHRANTAQQQQQMKRVQLLVILTMAPHLDFVTVTVKSVRGMPKEKAPSIHLRLFDGSLLLEERVPSRKNGDLSSRHGASAPTTKARQVPPSAPLRLPFCHIVLSLYAVSFDGAEEEPQPQQLLGSCQLGPSGSASSGHSQRANCGMA
uniref:C2 domain-containing protein n=2 Tax=Globodera pallida TaxID=36090 RepID=A0A183CDR5_GLOPA